MRFEIILFALLYNKDENKHRYAVRGEKREREGESVCVREREWERIRNRKGQRKERNITLK